LSVSFFTLILCSCQTINKSNNNVDTHGGFGYTFKSNEVNNDGQYSGLIWDWEAKFENKEQNIKKYEKQNSKKDQKKY